MSNGANIQTEGLGQALVSLNGKALEVRTIDDAMALAKILADSDLVPKEFRGKPGNVLVAMQLGTEVGLHPMQALQSIAVINGKPCLWGDAVLGVCMASPAWGGIEESEEAEVATCKVWRKGQDAKPILRQFSRADAERIQMWESDGKGGGRMIPLAQRPTHKNYPKRMRQMRARGWALHDCFPDVLKGLRIAEEVQDYSDQEPTGPAAEPVNEMMPKRKETTMPEPAPVPPVVTDAVVTEVIPPPAPAADVPLGRVAFLIGRQSYETAGITAAQMLKTFDLAPKVDKARGKNTAAVLLKAEFGVDTRKDLTAEAADQYLVRLGELVDG